ncbi:hypothetical protein AX15_006924 [Amanita polypyramis BW_CC]|nr:hypothetical protein AX15_006924 [Amanita polypyramis BW_CC]
MDESLQARKGRIISSYVIHVAAYPPDASQHPQWNECAALDNTSWDSLPSEYQKRHITYNAVILNSHIRQFISLHSILQRSRAESKPWFSVRAPHTVLLSGISTLEEQKTTPTKRPGDPDRTPESKRIKLTQNKLEPHQGSGAASVQQTHAGPPQRTSNATGAVQHNTMIQIVSKIRALEEIIRTLETRISEARMAGNTQLVDNLSSDWKEHKEIIASCRRRLVEYNAVQPGGGPRGNKSPATDPLNNPSDGSPSLQKNGNPTLPSQSQIVDSRPTYAQSLDIVKAGGLIQQQSEASVAPYVTQVPQPSEQEWRQRGAQSVTGQPVQPLTQHLRSPQPTTNTQREQSNNNAKTVWNGQLIWNGLGSTGKKECRAKVVALSQNASECHADTWPSVITLVPTQEPAVPAPELREWIAKVKPVICRFRPQLEPDSTNEQYYKSLIQLLITKRVFAVARWTLPSGVQENNVLVFPMNNEVLFGAFFPMTGIPEMPKPHTILNATQVVAQLQRLPPEQRQYIIGQLLQRSNPQATSGIHTHSSTEKLGFNSLNVPPNGNLTATSSQNTGMLHQQSHTGGHNEIAAGQAAPSLFQGQGDMQSD